MSSRLPLEYVKLFYSAFGATPETPVITKDQYYKLVIAAINKEYSFGCFIRATFDNEETLNVVSWDELMELYTAFMDGYEKSQQSK